MATVGIGIDVGQKVDPTAIAVTEVEQRGDAVHYLVCHLERRPLGEPYPAVARRLGEIVAGTRAIALDPRRWVPGTAPPPGLTLTVWVDATGVGQPLVDLLAEAGEHTVACYFTHGDRRSDTWTETSIGKAWLVTRLKTLFQTNRLHLPQTAEAAAMRQELLDYELRVDADANDRYGAFRVGSHDDLVTALGLSVGTEPGSRRVIGESYLTFGRDRDRAPLPTDGVGNDILPWRR